MGEAGCTPLATSLIAVRTSGRATPPRAFSYRPRMARLWLCCQDFFLPDQRGAALGVYNMGIYVGYSMAFGAGNPITARYGGRGRGSAGDGQCDSVRRGPQATALCTWGSAAPG